MLWKNWTWYSWSIRAPWALHLWTNPIRCEWQAAVLQKQTIIVSCYPSVWPPERVKWAAVSSYSQKQTHTVDYAGILNLLVATYTALPCMNSAIHTDRLFWSKWFSLEAFVLMSYLLMSSVRVYEPQAKPNAFVWPQTRKIYIISHYSARKWKWDLYVPAFVVLECSDHSRTKTALFL